jgi:hypothetical protein
MSQVREDGLDAATTVVLGEAELGEDVFGVFDDGGLGNEELSGSGFTNMLATLGVAVVITALSLLPPRLKLT